MKKFNTVIFTILLFLVSTINVYADNKCIYAPGDKNVKNKVMIPKNGRMLCAYKYDDSASSWDGHPDSKGKNTDPNMNRVTQFVAIFDKNGTSIYYDYGTEIENYGYPDIYFDDQFNLVTSDRNNNAILDGEESRRLNEVQTDGHSFNYLDFDDEIYGCPYTFYYVEVDGVKNYRVYFSSKQNPTMNSKLKDFNYAVYRLDDYGSFDFGFIETDDVSYLNSGFLNPSLMTNYSSDDVEYYTEEYGWQYENQEHQTKYCGTTADIGFQTKHGANEHLWAETGSSQEELATCLYHFGKVITHESGNKCYVEEMKITYTKKSEAGEKSTVSVSTDYKAYEGGHSIIDYSNITGIFEARTFDIDNPSTWPNGTDASKHNFYDFLEYDSSTGKYSCKKTIYIVNPQNAGKETVFGSSRYHEFKGMYGIENITVGSLEVLSAEDLCPNHEIVSKYENTNDSDFHVSWGDPVEMTCEGILGRDFINFIKKILGWIQIIAPILVIILGGVDFATALISDDQDHMKKGVNKFAKRLIIAVILFFVPYLIEFLLTFFNEAIESRGGIGNASTCLTEK